MVSIDDIVGNIQYIALVLLLVGAPVLPFGAVVAIFLLGVVVKTGVHLTVLYNVPPAWVPIGKQDIALITGGSRGLGLEIVNQLVAKGVEKVIVLDIIPPSMETSPTVEYVECDIGDEQVLKSTLHRIIAQLALANKQISICINNAGIDHRHSLLDISDQDIHKLFLVNTMAQIWTLRTILQHHLVHSPHKQLFIVSISSILGTLAPKNLSVYLATKAAIIQIHEGLTQELKQHAKTIRFLLVAPGQLDTKMFQDIDESNPFLAPIVSHVELAKEVVHGVDIGYSGSLAMPLYANFLPLVKCLPTALQDMCRCFSGMDDKIKS